MPELEPLISSLLELAARHPQPEPRTPEEARLQVKQRIASIPRTTARIASETDIVLPLPGRNIRGRVYRPLGLLKPGIVMFFHGGGWSVCDLDTHDNLCRRLCADSGRVILSVDYRLAPEDPYPAAFDDCFDATVWVQEQGSGLGIDSERFVLCGDSAGGNLAAAVAMALRDRGERAPCGQVLIYPGLRDPRLGGPTYDAFGEGYGLTRADALRSWRNYFPDESAPVPAYAAPLHGDRFDGLPPTLIVTAECDILRDEAEQFCNALARAGVEVHLLGYRGVTHGFLALEPVLDVAGEACRSIADWMAEQLKG